MRGYPTYCCAGPAAPSRGVHGPRGRQLLRPSQGPPRLRPHDLQQRLQHGQRRGPHAAGHLHGVLPCQLRQGGRGRPLAAVRARRCGAGLEPPPRHQRPQRGDHGNIAAPSGRAERWGPWGHHCGVEVGVRACLVPRIALGRCAANLGVGRCEANMVHLAWACCMGLHRSSWHNV